jgi:hypothetical protein
MTLTEREAAVKLKEEALCGELTLEEDMDLT